jgi:hypothetical protein
VKSVIQHIARSLNLTSSAFVQLFIRRTRVEPPVVEPPPIDAEPSISIIRPRPPIQQLMNMNQTLVHVITENVASADISAACTRASEQRIIEEFTLLYCVIPQFVIVNKTFAPLMAGAVIQVFDLDLRMAEIMPRTITLLLEDAPISEFEPFKEQRIADLVLERFNLVRAGPVSLEFFVKETI